MSTVVIEGPDGAGKSTLLRKLLEKNPEYRPAPRPCSSLGGALQGSDLVMYLVNYGSLGNSIYDRHPSISGAVYDAVFHQVPTKSIGQRLRGLFCWLTENARIIYCRPPIGIIVRSVLKEPQMEGVARNIYQIVDTYDSIMANIVPHETYDWTTDDLPDL